MIPEGWKKVKWGDIATLEYGKSLNNYQGNIGNVPVYGTNGLIGYTERPLCNFPSVIIGRKGAYRGVHYSKIPFFVIDTAFYLKPIKSDLNLKFAYYQILTKNINEIDSGSAIPSTSRKDFYNLDLLLPDKENQEKITSILSSLDDKIDLNLKMNRTIEAIAQAIFKEWFMDFRYPGFESEHKDELPEGWNRGKLGDCCKIYRGASPRPITDPKYFSNGTVPWIKISDATAEGSFYITKTKEFCTELAVSKSRFIKRGTLVLSNSATVGVPMILDLDGCVHDGWLIFDDYTGISKNFLFYTLLSNAQKLISMADGSVQKNLNTGILKNLDIVIPDESSVKRFNTISTALFDRILANERENQILKGIRDTLLPKLMTGEILIN